MNVNSCLFLSNVVIKVNIFTALVLLPENKQVCHIYTPSRAMDNVRLVVSLIYGTEPRVSRGAPQLGQVSQLVSLIYGTETRVPRGASQLSHQLQLGFVWDFSILCPRSFLSDFLLLYCDFPQLHPNCYHARGKLCGIHTSCMGSSFSIVHTECSCTKT